MRLVGMLDSPYVRRVAVTLKLMGLPFQHESVSVFRHFDHFRSINPVVKAPTLVCDDGTVLMDSQLMLDYLDALAPARSLMPADAGPRTEALRLIGLGLVACEKTVQRYYETELRPPERQHAPWIERVGDQARTAYALLERAAQQAAPWLQGTRMSQADVTVAIAWRFTEFIQPGLVDPAQHPALAALSARAEALPEFASTPLE